MDKNFLIKTSNNMGWFGGGSIRVGFFTTQPKETIRLDI